MMMMMMMMARVRERVKELSVNNNIKRRRCIGGYIERNIKTNKRQLNRRGRER